MNNLYFRTDKYKIFESVLTIYLNGSNNKLT